MFRTEHRILLAPHPQPLSRGERGAGRVGWRWVVYLCGLAVFSLLSWDRLPACQSPPPPPAPVLYDGRTLDEWRDAIKWLDPRSADAPASVPGLLAIVEDPQAPWFTRRQAALTLGRIGPGSARAVPLVTELAAQRSPDGDSTTQVWAVQALALWGPVAAPATPTLIEIATQPQPDPHLRLVAIEALGRIGVADPRSLPAVIELLASHTPRRATASERTGQELDLVTACIEGLDLYGGEANIAVPVLLRFSEDREARVRRAVAVTLGRIGLRADQAAPRLAEFVLADPSEDIRDVAAVSLGQVGGTPLLSRLLTHPDEMTRERAAVGLGWSVADEAPRTSLETARRDPAPRVRMAAIEATQKRFPNPAVTAPLAAHELTASDRDVRLRAVRFLTRLGSKATPAMPVLKELAEGPDRLARESAQRLLRQLEP